jgi:hypothetical protein
MGNFGGLLIIGIGFVIAIMGIKGTWQNLFPSGFFSSFFNNTQANTIFPSGTPQFRIPRSAVNGTCPQGWQNFDDSSGQWCVPSGTTSASSNTPTTTSV